MTQAKAKLASFEEYLAYSDETPDEGRYELVQGELVELPPESRLNSTIAIRVLLGLLAAGIAVELIHPGKCEVQVPVLQSSDAVNRYPDLVVLRSEHLELTGRRLTITRDMAPPRLVVEVVSPGKTNRDRDYVHKRAQYAAIGVPEYWLIDPVAQTVMVLSLTGDGYQEIGVFRHEEALAEPCRGQIASPEIPDLTLTTAQIFVGES